MENENLSREDLDNEDAPENLASYVSVDDNIQTKEPFIFKFWKKWTSTNGRWRLE